MENATKNGLRKAVGKNLQRLRKAAGFSSAVAFAEKVGINKNTYTQYEQGISGLSYERAWELADALECSLDELGGREWPGEQQALSAEEQQLVSDYRRIDESDQPALLTTASTMAYAGDAKKEDPAIPTHLAKGDVKG